MNALARVWMVGTVLLLFAAAPAEALVDDRAITLHSSRDVADKRQMLVAYLWGPEGFPRHLPRVVTNIPSPVRRLTHLARVDELRIEMGPGLEGLAYHFIAQRPNRELVVVHHGHACTLDDDPSPTDVGFGLHRTIQRLLRQGYGV